MNGVRILRWALVGLGALLAIVLFARGDLVVAGLVAALVVTRASLLVAVQRRRRRWRGDGPRGSRFRDVGGRSAA